LAKGLVEAFLHEPGVTQDGSERSSQLVAHVGDELGLVLTRYFEFAALFHNLIEQPHILDRDRGLISASREKANVLLLKRSCLA
jgi:hypothetical protein